VGPEGWGLVGRLPEGWALAGVGEGGVERAARDADCRGRDADATAVESDHGEGEAAADMAEHGVVTDVDAVEHELRGRGAAQAELVLEASHGEARRIAGHDQGGDPSAGTATGAGRRGERPRD